MPSCELQTQKQTQLFDGLSTEFAKLYSRWCSLINSCPCDLIYSQFHKDGRVLFPSVGESILRSAATVEQTCGGITANLWDDPFDWTLPESLTTRERILEYLGEVESTRKQAFSSIVSDLELVKQISLPSGRLQPLGSLLLETLTRACELQGRASLTAQILSAQNTSGFLS